MYELQPVTFACEAFLAQHITKDSYTRLPEAQLQQLRHWLEVAVELGLSRLRATVLECLQDCMLKAVKTALLLSMSMGCPSGYQTDLRRFQQVWGKKSTTLAATLTSLQAGELRPLLEELLLPAFNRAV
jgi:hypothetical protein